MSLIGTYLMWLIYAFNFAIFGRVVMSWISPRGGDPVSGILIQITEPVIAPIRTILPKFGMFDLSPMVALILLNFIILPAVRAVF